MSNYTDVIETLNSYCDYLYSLDFLDVNNLAYGTGLMDMYRMLSAVSLDFEEMKRLKFAMTRLANILRNRGGVCNADLD